MQDFGDQRVIEVWVTVWILFLVTQYFYYAIYYKAGYCWNATVAL